MKLNRGQLFFMIMIFAIAAPQPASAYVGPGTGIGVIGAALAFIGAVFLAIIGFIWYPIKRFWRSVVGRRRNTAHSAPR